MVMKMATQVEAILSSGHEATHEPPRMVTLPESLTGQGLDIGAVSPRRGLLRLRWLYRTCTMLNLFAGWLHGL